jgi:ArsR family transcriptional regulator
MNERSTVADAVTTLQLLGEPSRVRLLALLAREELTVAELCAATGLAQSRVSTHLGKLREAGVLRDRRDGTSTYYALSDDRTMPAGARRVWSAIEADIDDAVLAEDRARCERVVRARGDGGGGWADEVAGEMERHYSPGRTWESLARGLLGVLRCGDVLDVGAGDGTVAQLLAPRARRVTCVDRNERMVAAANRRLAGVRNVRCVVGDAAALPFDADAFDHVLLFNVLECVERPILALAEAERVLRPGGEVVVTALAKHTHGEATVEYGHVHAGFSPGHLHRMLKDAGLAVVACAVTSREKRPPRFGVITASARKEPKEGT